MEPIVKQMELERQRVIKAMGVKNLDEEEYKTMVEALDKLTKNVQLLSGKETENVKVTGYEEMTDDELDYAIEQRRKNKPPEAAGRETEEV